VSQTAPRPKKGKKRVSGEGYVLVLLRFLKKIIHRAFVAYYFFLTFTLNPPFSEIDKKKLPFWPLVYFRARYKVTILVLNRGDIEKNQNRRHNEPKRTFFRPYNLATGPLECEK
jgi:hypothetical protein